MPSREALKESKEGLDLQEGVRSSRGGQYWGRRSVGEHRLTMKG